MHRDSAPRPLTYPVGPWARLVRRLWGGLLPCPGCGIRPAGEHGCCAVCRRLALRPSAQGSRLWLGPYAGPLGRLVRALKYRGATHLARWLGSALAAEVRAAGWQPQLLCPVPLHPARRRSRGYDQAALLASSLAAALTLPCAPLLQRCRPTAPQARLGRGDRAANVAGAFSVAPRADIVGRRVLLVDDVLTTGATSDACRTALLRAGASEVRVAVVARADRHPVSGR